MLGRVKRWVEFGAFLGAFLKGFREGCEIGVKRNLSVGSRMERGEVMKSEIGYGEGRTTASDHCIVSPQEYCSYLVCGVLSLASLFAMDADGCVGGIGEGVTVESIWRVFLVSMTPKYEFSSVQEYLRVRLQLRSMPMWKPDR